MDQNITDEFNKLVSGGDEAQAATPSEVQNPVETVDYYLGDKANKLPVNAEFSITHDGKVVRAPLSTIVNHYRQRADLDGKFKSLKQEREAWEKERGDAETYKQLRQKYEAIQKWSEENPQDWETLYGLYQNKDKHLLAAKPGEAQSGELSPREQAIFDKLKSTEEKLAQLEGVAGKWQENLTQQQEEKDAAEVNQEVESFKKEFPEINLEEKNEDGLALKHQIMTFGVQNRIPDFESAALKFLKPKLMEVVALRARQEAVKGVKKDVKEGVVARSSKPFNGQGSGVNPKNLSWNDVRENAKAEFEQLIHG